MTYSESIRPRFRSRLKQFLSSLGEDLNLFGDGVATDESEITDGFERLNEDEDGQSASGVTFSASSPLSCAAVSDPDQGEQEGESEKRQQQCRLEIAQWEDRLQQILEARCGRKAKHSAILADSFRYVQDLIASARAKELEETAEPQPLEKLELPEPGPNAEAELEAFSPDDLGDYRMPSIGLLRPMATDALDFIQESEVEAQKNRLQDSIDSFSVDAYVYDAIVGPRVTQFRVKPGFGVRVETIAGLEKNIALALKVRAVRIQAPIPGESFVGIEVPNGNSLPLTLRSAFESRTWQSSEADIPIVLGMDINGRIVACDLAKAPHMLIAGATGSGKSVSISNIILSLLYRFRPDELELVLIDPKKVEFAMYKDLPHLIHPVVSEAKQACNILKWLVREMEKRYDLMSERKVRNIAGYNTKAEAEGFPRMPFMVLVVDELADLMMTAKDDVETPIARLAQMSRAVGIHTILATQRPSVNIITGVIKANFPTRVAFQVSSQVDSRTILDGKGAESLQGKGDMLYTPPGVGKLMRLQAPFVDDDEIVRVTEMLREQIGPRYRVALQVEDSGESESLFGEAAGEGADPLIKQAVEIISTTGRASTSFLQRKLRIGYNRAARLMEELEDRGYVGPQVGSNPREVLCEPGEFQL